MEKDISQQVDTICFTPKEKSQAFRKYEKRIHAEFKRKGTSIRNPEKEWHLFEGKELSKDIVNNA